MSNKIDSNYISDITNFPWYEDVSMENNSIIYKDITFTDVVIISGNNQVT